MYSFISQKPSFESIEVMENSILYCINYEELQNLYKTYSELNLIGRLLTEKYYIELEERTLSLQFQPAEERYKHLLENKPNHLSHLLAQMHAIHLPSLMLVFWQTWLFNIVCFFSISLLGKIYRSLKNPYF